MEPLDLLIETALEAVTEIADSVITKKIEKKRAEKKMALGEENTENETGSKESTKVIVSADTNCK